MIVKRIVSLLGGAILLSSISSIEKFSTRAAPVSVEDFHIDIADLSVDCDNTSGSSLGAKSKYVCLPYQPAIAGRSPAGPSGGRPVPGAGRPTTDPSRPETHPVITDPNLETGPGGAPVLGDPNLVRPEAPEGEPAGPAGAAPESRPDPNPNEPVTDLNAPGRSDVTLDPSVYTITDTSDSGFVRPNQIKDTIQAVADQKGIHPEDPGWWGWSGFDMTKKMENDPDFIGKIQQAIKDHMANPDLNPSFLRDVLPAEARNHWLESNVDILAQKETWNRMSYSFANWINGEHFYVVVEVGKDPIAPYPGKDGKGSPGNFALYEAFYITNGEKNFDSVWVIEIQPDGSVTVSAEPMWKKGGEKLGNEPNDAWVFADKFNLDLSGGPGRLIRERSAVV